MEITLKKVSVFLSAVLWAGSYVMAQNPYRWTDELELLKRVDKLPEYRTPLDHFLRDHLKPQRKQYGDDQDWQRIHQNHP